ncbi:MAG: hypothetical protein H6559_03320 [Lewinellaceae bacterium]|nr:hypothetical protein [Lewinellaceae bacterium]
MRENLERLLAKGKTNRVLHELLKIEELIQNEDIKEEILLQSARYESYLKEKRLGTSKIEDQEISIMKINEALLFIIKQLSSNAEDNSGKNEEKLSVVEIITDLPLKENTPFEVKKLISKIAELLSVDKDELSIKMMPQENSGILIELPDVKAKKLISLVHSNHREKLILKKNFNVETVKLLRKREKKIVLKLQSMMIPILASLLIVIIIIIVSQRDGFDQTFNFFSKSKFEKKDSYSLTVFVHGKRSRNDLVLKKVGFVEITYGTKKARESIDEKGQAIFNEIPNRFFDENARVYINVQDTNGEPYKSLYPDSLYELNVGEPIYLPVTLSGLDLVFGTVIWNDEPLEGVIVSAGRIRDTTDKLGNYNLQFPENVQKQQQQVMFFKPGFKLIKKNAYPQTQKSLDIIMIKSDY